MPRRAHGLTAIEIAIVLTVVGFVAAFVWPAWRDHTTRETVAEIVAAAAPAKATVDDYAAANGGLPPTEAIALPFIHSKHVRGSAWAASGSTGTLTVTTHPATGRNDAAIDARALVLTAVYDARAKAVRWACGGTPATTIDASFLPAHCR